MRAVPYILALLFVLVVAGSGWLFWVQNSQQEVVTSFELWGGLRYGRTWKVPVLIATSGGVGAFLGLIGGWWVTASLKNRRIKQLTSTHGG